MFRCGCCSRTPWESEELAFIRSKEIEADVPLDGQIFWSYLLGQFFILKLRKILALTTYMLKLEWFRVCMHGPWVWMTQADEAVHSLCAFMCLCPFVCVHVYVWVVCIYVYMWLYVCVYVCAYAVACVMYLYMLVCAHVQCIDVYVWMCVCMCMYVHMRVCMHMCIYAFMCVSKY